MNILDKIAADKREEVELKKELLPLDVLEILPYYQRSCISLKESLRKGSGIIAEFKRKSPSKKDINLKAEVEDITLGYQAAGASGISVLTDETYFGGTLDDLLLCRDLIHLPILRKDFIIDEYQIYESKAFGADVILLIAALLSPKQIQTFTKTAKALGLEVLLEVHNEEELQRSLVQGIDLVGVNNRNLKTFEVDLNTSRDLSNKIPSEFLKISESGISEVSSIQELKTFGYEGFLIGENFMRTADPAKSALDFIKALKP